MNREVSDATRQQMLRNLDGSMSEAEIHWLRAELEASPALQREFADLVRCQVQLGEIASELAGQMSAPQPVRPSWRWWRAAAFAACAGLGLVLAVWMSVKRQTYSPAAASFTLAQVSGEVWIGRGDTKSRAVAGTAIQPGDTVQTLTGATVVVDFARGGTRLSLREETALRLPEEDAKKIDLEQGTVLANVAKQPTAQPLVLVTPQAEATVMGTKLLVSADASSTHLAVTEGRVALWRRSDNATVEVTAGNLAVVSEGVVMTPRPYPTDGSGTGLLGEYCPWRNFDNPAYRRVDPEVQLDWGTDRPGPGLNVDHFQVRWTGSVQPKFTEKYIFGLVADDGVRLWVDGQLIVDQWDIRSRQTKMRGEISLAAGRKYDLRLEYYESSGKAFVSLYWQSESQPREIIPQSQLYPSPGAGVQ